MTKEQRAACLRAAGLAYAVSRQGCRKTAPEAKRCVIYDDCPCKRTAITIMAGFFPAAAALPNPHKLVGREATEGMTKAGLAAWYEPAENTRERIANISTAAHDAAPEWDGQP